MTATVAITITDAVAVAVAQRRQAGWRSLSQVDAELARGDLERAAQALWEAAAHGVKAAAAQRGWPHDSARALGEVITRLIDEEGGSGDLNTNFIIAHAFNRVDRAWEIPIDAQGVRYCKEPVAQLLRILEAMD